MRGTSVGEHDDAPVPGSAASPLASAAARVDRPATRPAWTTHAGRQAHALHRELQLLERGRRAVGQWPPDAGEAFLAGLNRLIAAEQDPDKRTRLAKLRDAAAEVGKSVLAGVVVAAGQAQLGG